MEKVDRASFLSGVKVVRAKADTLAADPSLNLHVIAEPACNAGRIPMTGDRFGCEYERLTRACEKQLASRSVPRPPPYHQHDTLRYPADYLVASSRY